MKILGLINARGGSKGIPRKNIQLLNGKPIISYAIKAGNQSKYIDRVVVSTDDDEIAEISKKFGAEVPFKRPDELAGDNVTQYPPTKHAILELKKQGWSPDIVALLEADVPLKTGEDIDKAIKLLIQSNADSVRSMCEVSTSPYWMFQLDKEGFVKPFVEGVKMEDPNICMRQNLPKVFQMTGVVDVTWTNTILDTNSLFGNKIQGIVFDRNKSIDIDTTLDLLLAETIMKHRDNIIIV